jgi:hypothetical protein
MSPLHHIYKLLPTVLTLLKFIVCKIEFEVFILWLIDREKYLESGGIQRGL